MGDTSSPESIPHVIIVGLGIVGLAAAIECREKGFTVTAFDKSDILEPIGTFAPLARKQQIMRGDDGLRDSFVSRRLYWYSIKRSPDHPTMG